jgi:tryptophanyl-tRNA synthetase
VDCRSAAIGCVDCKKLFAKNLNAHLAPFRAKRAELAAQPDLVWDVLAEGARRAQAIAGPVLAEVKAAIGLP